MFQGIKTCNNNLQPTKEAMALHAQFNPLTLGWQFVTCRWEFKNICNHSHTKQQQTTNKQTNKNTNIPWESLASPVEQPPSPSHSSLSPWPAALWMAPSTPPPPSRELLAALTMASISRQVMSPRQRDTLWLRAASTSYSAPSGLSETGTPPEWMECTASQRVVVMVNRLWSY